MFGSLSSCAPNSRVTTYFDSTKNQFLDIWSNVTVKVNDTLITTRPIAILAGDRVEAEVISPASYLGYDFYLYSLDLVSQSFAVVNKNNYTPTVKTPDTRKKWYNYTPRNFTISFLNDSTGKDRVLGWNREIIDVDKLHIVLDPMSQTVNFYSTSTSMIARVEVPGNPVHYKKIPSDDISDPFTKELLVLVSDGKMYRIQFDTRYLPSDNFAPTVIPVIPLEDLPYLQDLPNGLTFADLGRARFLNSLFPILAALDYKDGYIWLAGSDQVYVTDQNFNKLDNMTLPGEQILSIACLGPNSAIVTTKSQKAIYVTRSGANSLVYSSTCLGTPCTMPGGNHVALPDSNNKQLLIIDNLLNYTAYPLGDFIPAYAQAFEDRIFITGHDTNEIRVFFGSGYSTLYFNLKTALVSVVGDSVLGIHCMQDFTTLSNLGIEKIIPFYLENKTGPLSHIGSNPQLIKMLGQEGIYAVPGPGVTVWVNGQTDYPIFNNNYVGVSFKATNPGNSRCNFVIGEHAFDFDIEVKSSVRLNSYFTANLVSLNQLILPAIDYLTPNVGNIQIGATALELGFNLNFYGNTYSNLMVTTDGVIILGPDYYMNANPSFGSIAADAIYIEPENLYQGFQIVNVDPLNITVGNLSSGQIPGVYANVQNINGFTGFRLRWVGLSMSSYPLGNLVPATTSTTTHNEIPVPTLQSVNINDYVSGDGITTATTVVDRVTSSKKLFAFNSDPLTHKIYITTLESSLKKYSNVVLEGSLIGHLLDFSNTRITGNSILWQSSPTVTVDKLLPNQVLSNLDKFVFRFGAKGLVLPNAVVVINESASVASNVAISNNVRLNASDWSRLFDRVTVEFSGNSYQVVVRNIYNYLIRVEHEIYLLGNRTETDIKLRQTTSMLDVYDFFNYSLTCDVGPITNFFSLLMNTGSGFVAIPNTGYLPVDFVNLTVIRLVNAGINSGFQANVILTVSSDTTSDSVTLRFDPILGTNFPAQNRIKNFIFPIYRMSLDRPITANKNDIFTFTYSNISFPNYTSISVAGNVSYDISYLEITSVPPSIATVANLSLFGNFAVVNNSISVSTINSYLFKKYVPTESPYTYEVGIYVNKILQYIELFYDNVKHANTKPIGLSSKNSVLKSISTTARQGRSVVFASYRKTGDWVALNDGTFDYYKGYTGRELDFIRVMAGRKDYAKFEATVEQQLKISDDIRASLTYGYLAVNTSEDLNNTAVKTGDTITITIPFGSSKLAIAPLFSLGDFNMAIPAMPDSELGTIPEIYVTQVAQPVNTNIPTSIQVTISGDYMIPDYYQPYGLIQYEYKLTRSGVTSNIASLNHFFAANDIITVENFFTSNRMFDTRTVVIVGPSVLRMSTRTGHNETFDFLNFGTLQDPYSRYYQYTISSVGPLEYTEESAYKSSNITLSSTNSISGKLLINSLGVKVYKNGILQTNNFNISVTTGANIQLEYLLPNYFQSNIQIYQILTDSLDSSDMYIPIGIWTINNRPIDANGLILGPATLAMGKLDSFYYPSSSQATKILIADKLSNASESYLKLISHYQPSGSIFSISGISGQYIYSVNQLTGDPHIPKHGPGNTLGIGDPHIPKHVPGDTLGIGDPHIPKHVPGDTLGIGDPHIPKHVSGDTLGIGDPRTPKHVPGDTLGIGTQFTANLYKSIVSHVDGPISDYSGSHSIFFSNISYDKLNISTELVAAGSRSKMEIISTIVSGKTYSDYMNPFTLFQDGFDSKIIGNLKDIKKGMISKLKNNNSLIFDEFTPYKHSRLPDIVNGLEVYTDTKLPTTLVKFREFWPSLAEEIRIRLETKYGINKEEIELLLENTTPITATWILQELLNTVLKKNTSNIRLDLKLIHLKWFEYKNNYQLIKEKQLPVRIEHKFIRINPFLFSFDHTLKYTTQILSKQELFLTRRDFIFKKVDYEFYQEKLWEMLEFTNYGAFDTYFQQWVNQGRGSDNLLNLGSPKNYDPMLLYKSHEASALLRGAVHGIFYFHSGNVLSHFNNINYHYWFDYSHSNINVKTWTIGSGSLSDYIAYGTGSYDNTRIVALDPWDQYNIIWQVNSNDSTMDDIDGGWETPLFDVDPQKDYMSSVWIRRISSTANGIVFFGFDTNGTGPNRANPTYNNASAIRLDDNNGDANVFWSSRPASDYEQNKWYLHIGHVYAAYVQLDPYFVKFNEGIYDTSGALKMPLIYSGSEGMANPSITGFKFTTNTTQARQKVFLKAANDNTTVFQFYGPRWEVVDGNHLKKYQQVLGGYWKQFPTTPGVPPITPTVASYDNENNYSLINVYVSGTTLHYGDFTGTLQTYEGRRYGYGAFNTFADANAIAQRFVNAVPFNIVATDYWNYRLFFNYSDPKYNIEVIDTTYEIPAVLMDQGDSIRLDISGKSTGEVLNFQLEKAGVSVEYILIGGGGGGGSGTGGGGGSGGVLVGNVVLDLETVYHVKVGYGGSGGNVDYRPFMIDPYPAPHDSNIYHRIEEIRNPKPIIFPPPPPAQPTFADPSTVTPASTFAGNGTFSVLGNLISLGGGAGGSSISSLSIGEVEIVPVSVYPVHERFEGKALYKMKTSDGLYLETVNRWSDGWNYVLPNEIEYQQSTTSPVLTGNINFNLDQIPADNWPISIQFRNRADYGFNPVIPIRVTLSFQGGSFRPDGNVSVKERVVSISNISLPRPSSALIKWAEEYATGATGPHPDTGAAPDYHKNLQFKWTVSDTGVISKLYRTLQYKIFIKSSPSPMEPNGIWYRFDGMHREYFSEYYYIRTERPIPRTYRVAGATSGRAIYMYLDDKLIFSSKTEPDFQANSVTFTESQIGTRILRVVADCSNVLPSKRWVYWEIFNKNGIPLFKHQITAYRSGIMQEVSETNFFNGDFEITFPNEKNEDGIDSFPGWLIYIPGVTPNVPAGLRLNGFSDILGHPTPNDPTPSPLNAKTPYGDDVSATSMTFSWRIVDGSVPGFSGNSYIQLSSNGVTEGFGIVRGPYLVSEKPVKLVSGDKIYFHWQATEDGDFFDVFAYLLDEDTGQTITLLDETDGTSNWNLVEKTITSPGNYRFIFINGSYDSSGGAVLGASLNIDNIFINDPPSPTPPPPPPAPPPPSPYSDLNGKTGVQGPEIDTIITANLVQRLTLPSYINRIIGYGHGGGGAYDTIANLYGSGDAGVTVHMSYGGGNSTILSNTFVGAGGGGGGVGSKGMDSFELYPEIYELSINANILYNDVQGNIIGDPYYNTLPPFFPNIIPFAGNGGMGYPLQECFLMGAGGGGGGYFYANIFGSFYGNGGSYGGGDGGSITSGNLNLREFTIGANGLSNYGGGGGGGFTWIDQSNGQTISYNGGFGARGIVVLKYSKIYDLQLTPGIEYTTMQNSTHKTTTITNGLGNMKFKISCFPYMKTVCLPRKGPTFPVKWWQRGG